MVSKKAREVNIPHVTQKEASVFDSRPDRDWLNPISMSRLKDAVGSKAKKVVLNGVEFAITYGHTFTYKTTGEVVECVKLQRTDGDFVPFGYIAMQTIEKFRFDG
jgi:hypothetical protein